MAIITMIPKEAMMTAALDISLLIRLHLTHITDPVGQVKYHCSDEEYLMIRELGHMSPEY